MVEHEASSDFLRLAQAKGYQGWSQQGPQLTDSRGRPYVRGGIITLAKTTLCALKVDGYATNGSFIHTLKVGGAFRVLNCYHSQDQPWPDFQAAIQDQLSDHHPLPALAIGDSNRQATATHLGLELCQLSEYVGNPQQKLPRTL